MFKVLENDGHNHPVWHLFESQLAAEQYIGDEFDTWGEIQDENGATWTAYEESSGLYTIDHRKEG